MPTTAAHMAARSDNDLVARLVAQAEMMDVPADWIMQNIVKLIQVPIADGQTITDVHAFAAQHRREYIAATPDPAGADPAAVIDAYLEAAITAVRDAATTPPTD